MKNWEKRMQEFEEKEAARAQERLERKEHKKREKDLKREKKEEEEEEKRRQHKRERDSTTSVEEPPAKTLITEDSTMDLDSGGAESSADRKRKAEDIGDEERINRGEDVDLVERDLEEERDLALAWVAEVRAEVEGNLKKKGKSCIKYKIVPYN